MSTIFAQEKRYSSLNFCIVWYNSKEYCHNETITELRAMWYSGQWTAYSQRRFFGKTEDLSCTHTSYIFFANVCLAGSLIKRICSVLANRALWLGLWMYCKNKDVGIQSSIKLHPNIQRYFLQLNLLRLSISLMIRSQNVSENKPGLWTYAERKFSNLLWDKELSAFPSFPQLWLKCLAAFVLFYLCQSI